MILLSDYLKEYTGIIKFETNLEQIETFETCSKEEYKGITATVTYSNRVDSMLIYNDILILSNNIVYVYHTDRSTRLAHKSIIQTLVYKLKNVYRIEDSTINKFKILGKEKDLQNKDTLKKLVDNNQLTLIF